MPTAYPLPELHRGSLSLRPTELKDAPALLKMLAEPAVAEWWGHNTLESLTQEMAGAFTILDDGEVAGLLECHEEPGENYPSVAFDIFLGTRYQTRGIGRTALRIAIDHFVDHGHHRFTIDPTVTNGAAVRSYAAVGFRPVGVLRAAERSPRGEWRDALLMDLLAWELDGCHPALTEPRAPTA